MEWVYVPSELCIMKPSEACSKPIVATIKTASSTPYHRFRPDRSAK